MSNPVILVILPYTAVSFSILARFIFMYLLYTKRSTNVYSLTFAHLSILSSTLWIPYGVVQSDTPIIVRSTVEIVLLSSCALYITYNRWHPLPLTGAPTQRTIMPSPDDITGTIVPYYSGGNLRKISGPLDVIVILNQKALL